MTKICKITNKSSVVGGGYSNRTRATKFNPTGRVRKYTNLQRKKIFVPELGKTVNVKISTRGMRTLKKKRCFCLPIKSWNNIKFYKIVNPKFFSGFLVLTIKLVPFFVFGIIIEIC